MCGICGVSGGAREHERDAVGRMMASIAHRGPDDGGRYDDEGAVLGNRRLAIIDVTRAGQQPLGTRDGRFWITFNGEIYNYREIRLELEGAGARFRTGTDTEVLLELYRRRGRACLDRLRGMFAFAIWDRRDGRLFAARDHFGQKPFCYAVSRGRLIFASEVKAILAHGDVPAVPDPTAVDEYLSLRFVPAPRTMFRGIRKLPAAHWLEWTRNSLRVQQYWRPVFGDGGARRPEDWLAELPERIEETVGAHMVGDVAVGAFLSGGLDSGVVVSAMSRLAEEPVQTFCVGSDIARLDERGAARTMSLHCGTQHRESRVSSGVLRDIPRLVRALDEPTDPIAACIDSVSRLAAGNVKVVLGGDGGDEVFGGFDRYAAFPTVARVASLPEWVGRRVMAPALRAVPESFHYKGVGQRLRWLASVVTERDGGRLYARMTTHFRFNREDRVRLYGPVLRETLAARDAGDVIAEAWQSAPVSADLDRMIWADVMTRLPEHTLALSDRLAMAHGLEVRSPLLDVGFANFCFGMPAGLRIRGRITKYALRRAVRDWLPADHARRPKQGFMLPVAHWLEGDEMHRVHAELAGGRLAQEGWIERDEVERLLRDHAHRRSDNHVRIWMLLGLEAWHRMYLDGGYGSGEMVAAAMVDAAV